MKANHKIVELCFVVTTAALFICGAIAAVLSIFTLINAAKIAVSITVLFIALDVIMLAWLFADSFISVINASDDNQSKRR